MKISNHDEGSENLVGSSKSLKQTEDTGKGSSKSFEQTEDIGKSTTGKRKMRTRSVVKSHVNNHSPPSSSGGLIVPSDDQMQKKPSELNSNVKNNADVLLSTRNLEVTIPDESPRDGYKSPDMANTSPANFKTPVK
ncbi:mediator of DNA damage checkpoint protein, partial [Trifolium medium]|nr:mediator of DNA damage checkpoint protein [Trifolium medium]